MMEFDLSRFMRTYGIQDYHNAKMVLMCEKTNYRGEDTDVNMVGLRSSYPLDWALYRDY